eukprot:scaffold646_cov367-Prasinococcus_capsulatus_cf.AAC.4
MPVTHLHRLRHPFAYAGEQRGQGKNLGQAGDGAQHVAEVVHRLLQARFCGILRRPVRRGAKGPGRVLR